MPSSYASPNACKCARSRIACSGHLFAHTLPIKTVDAPAITCSVHFGAQHVLQGCYDLFHMHGSAHKHNYVHVRGRNKTVLQQNLRKCANKYGKLIKAAKSKMCIDKVKGLNKKCIRETTGFYLFLVKSLLNDMNSHC